MFLVYRWAAVNAWVCAGDRTPLGLGSERLPLMSCVCLCDVVGLWGSDDTQRLLGAALESTGRWNFINGEKAGIGVCFVFV